VVVHYLRLSIVPAPLVFWYGWWPAGSWITVAPQAGLLAALAVLTAVALAKRRPIGLVGAWFFLILAPTSSFLPIFTEVAAEHRMYLPVASVIALVVLGVFALCCRVLETRAVSRPIARSAARMAAWVVLGVGAVTLATLAHARNRDYWSNEALLADTVQKRPANMDARIALGVELLQRARYGDAESQLRVALATAPRPGSGVGPTAGAHMYLGSALCAQHKLEEGITQLEQALALNPRLSEAHGFLAEAYVSAGRFADAATAFDRAVSELPDLPPLLYRAAWFFATTSDRSVRNGAKAVALAEQGVQVTGGRDWMVLDALAVAYAEQGRFAEAVEASRRAVALAQETGAAGAGPELERHLARFQSGQPLQPR
jgi:tetratricopeptide (TPR) repeat protein